MDSYRPAGLPFFTGGPIYSGLPMCRDPDPRRILTLPVRLAVIASSGWRSLFGHADTTGPVDQPGVARRAGTACALLLGRGIECFVRPLAIR
jgi:hypothetical protein